MPTSDAPIDLADTRDAWERQPGESEVQYRRFTQYQNLGRARTVKAVAADLGKSASYLHNIAHRYRWRERAQLWDADQDRLFLERLTDERQRMVDDHLKLSRGMLSKVARRLKTLDPDELTPADLNRWAATLTQIQARVLGEPTQTVAVQGGMPGSPPIEIAAVTGDPVEQRERFNVLRTRMMDVLAAGTLDELDPADLDPAHLASEDT
jgi:ParB-like chromosome segregation protein Spo0J